MKSNEDDEGGGLNPLVVVMGVVLGVGVVVKGVFDYWKNKKKSQKPPHEVPCKSESEAVPHIKPSEIPWTGKIKIKDTDNEKGDEIFKKRFDANEGQIPDNAKEQDMRNGGLGEALAMRLFSEMGIEYTRIPDKPSGRADFDICASNIAIEIKTTSKKEVFVNVTQIQYQLSNHTNPYFLVCFLNEESASAQFTLPISHKTFVEYPKRQFKENGVSVNKFVYTKEDAIFPTTEEQFKSVVLAKQD